MKRLIIGVLIISMIFSQTTWAKEGEMGYMGGVSEGSNLPKTIEKYITIPSKTTNTYQYKEVVFLSGRPIVMEGTITVNLNTAVVDTKPVGSYKEVYTVNATNTDESATLTRNLSFTTYYRVIDGEFKKQIVTSSELDAWTETLALGDATYTLDTTMSSYSKAGVTDKTAGVSYFETSVSYIGRFTDGNGGQVILSASGSNIGFDQPWSKIENQTRNIEITLDTTSDQNMAIKTEAVLEAKKSIYYDATNTYPISFDGTYNQRMEREGTLTYQILTKHASLEDSDYTGSVAIKTANQIEKLPIPENLDFIEGHWAEDDIKKLYSMEVFTEIPRSGMQYEAINRGDYIKALCKAMNLDVSAYAEDNRVIFGDVTPDNPLYPYVMVAYDRKLIKGTGTNFEVSRPITREEAFVIYIRIIGLERLGVTESPVTPFVDDATISTWAKKEIMAGYKLGIIKGDSSGKVNPKRWISKAEAAAIINRLIDYLRDEIGEDYRQ